MKPHDRPSVAFIEPQSSLVYENLISECTRYHLVNAFKIGPVSLIRPFRPPSPAVREKPGEGLPGTFLGIRSDK